jgi:hypothetical protein
MVKRHTIALLATEEAVPLKLTARQQALVDAVANRVPPAERPRIASRQNAHENQQGALRTLTVAGRTQGDSDATGRVVSQSGHLSG